MTLAGLLIFAAAYALAIASPGPGVAAVVGHVLARGIAAAPAVVAGILIGDLVWLALAATGLAAIAQSHAALFSVIKWLGAAYLLYLAWQMWRAPATGLDPGSPQPVSHGRLFLNGLTLTLGNPKAIVFFLALLPAIIDLRDASLASLAEVAGLMVVILPMVFASYALAAHAARGFFRSAAAIRHLNRAAATALAGAAAAIGLRG